MRFIKAQDLESAVKKHGVGPLYLISGEEDYLRDQTVAVVKAAVLGEDGGGLAEFNFDVLHGDESDASEILSRVGEAPAFAARRLVLVKSAEKLSPRDGDALLSYLKVPCETTTLVFVTPKLDGRTKFALVLKEEAVVVDCSPMPDQQLPIWIRAEAGRLGVHVNEDAVLLLRDIAGSGSLALVRRELEKLTAYVGEGRTIGLAEVEAVRGSKVGASVFDLTAAIGARNCVRVLRIAARNLEAGEPPLRILGSLVWQYRQLWKAKDVLKQNRETEAGQLLRMPPFRAREFLGKFSESHLRAAFRMFLETDSKLKGGSASAPGRVLEALLLDLCRRAGSGSTPGGQASVVKSPSATPGVVKPTRMIRTVRPTRPSPR